MLEDRFIKIKVCRVKQQFFPEEFRHYRPPVILSKPQVNWVTAKILQEG
jgi:hypothetical protein